MDLNSFLDRLVFIANDIDMGRKGLAVDGKEHEGRISYEKGITGAATAFQEAQTTADPHIIIFAELVFLQQELQFCHESDTDTHSSLTQAIQSFEDALRCLQTVENKTLYQGAETTHPTSPKYRIQNFPKDAFHLACIAHRTRIGNTLRSPGINMTEKAVLRQRAANMQTAQQSYSAKQEKALGGKKGGQGVSQHS
jgi:hypothetical protein